MIPSVRLRRMLQNDLLEQNLKLWSDCSRFFLHDTQNGRTSELSAVSYIKKLYALKNIKKLYALNVIAMNEI